MMTIRQKILKAIYPLLMKAGSWFNVKAAVLRNDKMALPKVSFYTLSAIANNGALFFFSALKNKKVLLVNIASDCGYTGQLSELQALQEQNKDKLVIIGFPANDFKEQEKGSNPEIASFCSLNYGVDFMLIGKSSVVKGKQQNDVYKWLTDKQHNGWNDTEPEWNFAKYLVDQYGILTHYFGPAVSPLSSTITQQL